MTRTQVKTMVGKVMTVGLLAGAFVMAAPAKAKAQGVSFGVQLGGPVYSGYGDGRRGYWEHERREAYERQLAFERQQAWLRQQDFLRHEAWEREHRFRGRDDRRYDGGYDRGYDRDRDDRYRGGDRDDFRR